ncbi:MAG: flagellar basal body-associated FliL family protein [Burkholderiales bacterium]
MSAAAPTVDAGVVVPVKKGKKKLIIIALAVVLVLAIAGGAAVFFMKKRAAQAAEGGDDAAAAHAEHSAKPDLKHPPTFLPLDPFVVNLADKESDRYAQIGITLEVEDSKFAEQMKAFMPAIRNGILMILAHKNSRELLDRAGKEQLADEILRESARTMGIDVGEAPAVDKDEKATKADDATDEDEKPKAKPKKKVAKAPAEPNPIKHVHFSNFIVQ